MLLINVIFSPWIYFSGEAERYEWIQLRQDCETSTRWVCDNLYDAIQYWCLRCHLRSENDMMTYNIAHGNAWSARMIVITLRRNVVHEDQPWSIVFQKGNLQNCPIAWFFNCSDNHLRHLFNERVLHSFTIFKRF